MSEEISPESTVRLRCVCESELCLDPRALGKLVRCPKCHRYLRASLQFLMVDEQVAPNITVLCTCGHFVVAPKSSSGKPVKCSVCGQFLILPDAVSRPDSAPVVRVPPKALRQQMRKVLGKETEKRLSAKASRLDTASRGGSITLRPGQQMCINPDCSALLPNGANVCVFCGMNIKTKARYGAKGPEADPVGKWRAPE